VTKVEMLELCKEMDEQHKRQTEFAKQLAGFWPVVSFYIPLVGLHTWRYPRSLNKLLVEFIEKADPGNEREAMVMGYRGLGRLNEESGIGTCTINGIFIGHCKMHVCDGTRDSSKYHPENKWKKWRGIVFRDHADSDLNTAKVFTIADAFEVFLASKNIKFKRINVVRVRSK